MHKKGLMTFSRSMLDGSQRTEYAQTHKKRYKVFLLQHHMLIRGQLF